MWKRLGFSLVFLVGINSLKSWELLLALFLKNILLFQGNSFFYACASWYIQLIILGTSKSILFLNTTYVSYFTTTTTTTLHFLFIVFTNTCSRKDKVSFAMQWLSSKLKTIHAMQESTIEEILRRGFFFNVEVPL